MLGVLKLVWLVQVVCKQVLFVLADYKLVWQGLEDYMQAWQEGCMPV